MTSAALESIAAETRDIRYEIVVIDNGSTRDGSVDQLPRSFPSIQFIPNAGNMGFSVANNQGIARARGRYILLLNNDTIQTEDALGAAVRYMDAHAEVGGLGNSPSQRGCRAIGTSLGIRFSASLARSRHLDWRAVEHRLGAPLRADVEQDVDWVCGSFLLMRRACLEQIGRLDERFFIYDEDIDWCRRAGAAGWKIRFWPGASMVHVGASARPFMKDKTFVHFRSHLSYIRKHHSPVPAALYYLVMLGRLTLATLWQTVRWLGGAASLADVRERSSRQLQFALLRPGRTGG